eukprot:CAMPEP_0178881610 /NCGR_PEP_ID=MMETSP0747-20121128/13089_1 /TAXON_ID=913974 /ORGANISM="Nitzschia punctata, Strain CCMP561" /LENGTH=85 /DNA_ID=CAMNT_0020549583 /DNA_START=229 /DNA_END=486 /DNA_ORIENTATION=-
MTNPSSFFVSDDPRLVDVTALVFDFFLAAPPTLDGFVFATTFWFPDVDSSADFLLKKNCSCVVVELMGRCRCCWDEKAKASTVLD